MVLELMRLPYSANSLTRVWPVASSVSSRWPLSRMMKRWPLMVSSRPFWADVTVSLPRSVVAMKMLLPVLASGVSLSMKNTRWPPADSMKRPGDTRSMSPRP